MLFSPFIWPHIKASCALAPGCTVSLVTLLLLWFHTRCWPVNISKGLCGQRLVHKGRFQHPGRRRLSENRSLSVQPRMQTIFNTAKIKLREKGAMPGSSSVIIFHIVGPLSPHIMHSMARRKKTRRGDGENTWNNELSVRSYSGRAHPRYKGCKVEQCAYIDDWIYGGGSGTKSAVLWTECPHSDDQIQTQSGHFLERKNKRRQPLRRRICDGSQLTRSGFHSI